MLGDPAVIDALDEQPRHERALPGFAVDAVARRPGPDSIAAHDPVVDRCLDSGQDTLELGEPSLVGGAAFPIGAGAGVTHEWFGEQLVDDLEPAVAPDVVPPTLAHRQHRGLVGPLSPHSRECRDVAARPSERGDSTCLRGPQGAPWSTWLSAGS